MLIYGQMVPFIGGVILVTNILVVITDDLFSSSDFSKIERKSLFRSNVGLNND